MEINKINKITYFDNEISMLKIDECLAIGKFDNETYLVESVFSGDMFMDIMSADECQEVYGVNPNDISYFNKLDV